MIDFPVLRSDPFGWIHHRGNLREAVGLEVGRGLPTTIPCVRSRVSGGRSWHQSGQLGSAGDSAAMESFFALLQKNVLSRRSWATRHDLRIEIVTWIEPTDHRRRRQQRLGRSTPIDYETIMTHRTATAA